MSEQSGERPTGQYGPPPSEQPGYGQGGYGQGGYGQGGYGQPGYGYAPRPEMSPADQRLWACLAHVSAIVHACTGVSAVDDVMTPRLMR